MMTDLVAAIIAIGLILRRSRRDLRDADETERRSVAMKEKTLGRIKAI
jgi:hypothetical protein